MYSKFGKETSNNSKRQSTSKSAAVPCVKQIEEPKNQPAKPLLAISRYEWYLILVYGKAYSIEDIMMAIRKSISPETFTPYYMHAGGKDITGADVLFRFFVKSRSIALLLKQKARRLTLPHGRTITTSVWPRNPAIKPNADYTRCMYNVMCRRFDGKTQTMDLSCFHIDKQWKHEFCALEQPACLMTAIKIMNKHMPEVRTLLLDGNFLKQLDTFRGVEKLLPHLNCISLYRNRLDRLQTLDVLRGLRLEAINLDMVPLKPTTTAAQFEASLLKIFPHLKHVNGFPLTRPGEKLEQSVEASEAPKLPQLKQCFLVNAKAGVDIGDFLERYMQIFDGNTQRQELAAFYHKEAVVSVSVAKTAQTGWLKDNKIDSNILSKYYHKNQNQNHQLRAVAAIVAMFGKWPRTVHFKQSFTIDLTIFTRNLISFSVSGYFGELREGSHPFVRHFMRSFVLVSVDNEDNFAISNELINITLATPSSVKKLCLEQPHSNENKLSSLLVQSNLEVTNKEAVESPAQGHNELVSKLIKATNMNWMWSRKCLEDCNWEYEQALKTFEHLHKLGDIPPDAFNSLTENTNTVSI